MSGNGVEQFRQALAVLRDEERRMMRAFFGPEYIEHVSARMTLDALESGKARAVIDSGRLLSSIVAGRHT